MKTNAMTMNETRTSAMTKEQNPSPSSWLRLMTAMNSIH